MRLLYSTPDGDFASLAKETLREDGIEIFDPEEDTTVSSLESSGYGRYSKHTHTIYVANDEDFARAKRRLLQIGADDSRPTLPSGKVAIWSFHLVVLVISIFFILISK